MTKTCANCGLEKPNRAFNKDSKSSDGLQSWCRECAKRWREENLGAIEYKCVICGGSVIRANWVCKECYEEYNLDGLSSKEWPEWLQSLVRIERRQRYLNRLRNKSVEYLEDRYGNY